MPLSANFFGTKEQPNKPSRSAMQVAALVVSGAPAGDRSDRRKIEVEPKFAQINRVQRVMRAIPGVRSVSGRDVGASVRHPVLRRGAILVWTDASLHR